MKSRLRSRFPPLQEVETSEEIPLNQKFMKWLHIPSYVIIALLAVTNAWTFYHYWQAQIRYEALHRDHNSLLAHVMLLREEGIIREIVLEKLPKLDIETQARIAFEIYEGSRRSNIPSWLIMAIIETESGWKIDAISHAGAMGLMQIMPATGMAYARLNQMPVQSIEMFKDPVINIRLCIQVLLDNYITSNLSGKSPKGDFTRALWMYNSGGKPGAGEEYPRTVMANASEYQKRLSLK